MANEPTKQIQKPAAVPAKAEEEEDKNALPNKVTCTQCKAIFGVRHIVYAKRVEKFAALKGITGIPAVTEENLDEVKNNPAFIKARSLLDQTYLCRIHRPKTVKPVKEKKVVPVTGATPVQPTKTK